MIPTIRSSIRRRRGLSRRFARCGAAALFCALTLTACGRRDEPRVAAGTPVPSLQVPGAAAAPAPAYAPPPATIAEAAPGAAAAPRSGYAGAPVAAPVPPARVDDPPPVQPSPAPAGAARVAQASAQSGHLGSVESIEPIRARPQGSGAGAVIGGVLGGVVGNQFGHGLGRAAMTGLGAAGGAVAGNNVERNVRTRIVGYRVRVRLDDGHLRTFERSQIGNLHVGDRVRVDANGLLRA
jgi:outer membrane lipoprotein SlyB